MDAAALERGVRAELKRGYALRYNAMASILGVWGKEVAAGSFDAEERRFELELTDEETARIIAGLLRDVDDLAVEHRPPALAVTARW